MTSDDRRDIGRDIGDEPRLVRLGNLPREAEPSIDLWPTIESRIHVDRAGKRGRSAPWSARPWLQAAAAVALFAAGAASGLGVAPGPATPPPSSMDEALALAAEVQRTGSEYIAALTAFTSVLDSLSSDVRGQGTSAAFATLYSAADQLAALSARDPQSTIAETSELASRERRVRF